MLREILGCANQPRLTFTRDNFFREVKADNALIHIFGEGVKGGENREGEGEKELWLQDLDRYVSDRQYLSNTFFMFDDDRSTLQIACNGPRCLFPEVIRATLTLRS